MMCFIYRPMVLSVNILYANIIQALIDMKRNIRTFSHDNALVEMRRKEIVLSSTKVFVQKGYDRTTTRELAEALGMSTGGLYHYIGSKEDILHLILDFMVDTQRKRFDKILRAISGLRPRDALQTTIRLHMQEVDELSDMTRFMSHVAVNVGPDDRELMRNASMRHVAFYQDLLQRGVEAGEFKIENTHLFALSIVLMTQAWALRRRHLQEYTLDDYISELSHLILDTICINKNSELHYVEGQLTEQ
jgi:AcrR family transcriptional regulator